MTKNLPKYSEIRETQLVPQPSKQHFASFLLQSLSSRQFMWQLNWLESMAFEGHFPSFCRLICKITSLIWEDLFSFFLINGQQSPPKPGSPNWWHQKPIGHSVSHCVINPVSGNWYGFPRHIFSIPKNFKIYV